MMRWHKIFVVILLFALGSYGLTPSTADAALAKMTLGQMPPVKIVEQTRVEATELGCVQRQFADLEESILVPTEAPWPVLPSDVEQSEQAYEMWFCSAEAIDEMTVIGEVDAILNDIFEAIVPGAALIRQETGIGITTVLWEILDEIFEIAAEVGNWGIHLIANGIAPLLTRPFMLGIANLGFVLALLFIAISVILRLPGFDVRRLLVRLLIAALLINFTIQRADIIDILYHR